MQGEDPSIHNNEAEGWQSLHKCKTNRFEQCVFEIAAVA